MVHVVITKMINLSSLFLSLPWLGISSLMPHFQCETALRCAQDCSHYHLIIFPVMCIRLIAPSLPTAFLESSGSFLFQRGCCLDLRIFQSSPYYPSVYPLIFLTLSPYPLSILNQFLVVFLFPTLLCLKE